MDDREFDALARQFAIARSRRSVLRAVIGGGAALITTKAGTALAAPAPKVNVCHWDADTASYDSISISRNGWLNGHAKNHQRDFLRGDCCVASDCGPISACATSSCLLGVCAEQASFEVDCVTSDWSAWSACSVACGTGTRSRTRTTHIEAACGGSSCGPLVQEETCTTQSSVDCVASDWSAWSACSVACGTGTRSRTRTITTQASCGGSSCGPLIDEEACSSQSIVDCEVSEWSQWGACSAECGRGTTSRTRVVTTEATCGGAMCPHLTEVEDCASQMCNQCFGVTCPEHETCLDGECFAGAGHSSCGSDNSGVAANSGGVAICACGTGNQAVCMTSGECPDGQVCMLISEGGVDVGHCFMGCPFWNDPDPLD